MSKFQINFNEFNKQRAEYLQKETFYSKTCVYPETAPTIQESPGADEEMSEEEAQTMIMKWSNFEHSFSYSRAASSIPHIKMPLFPFFQSKSHYLTSARLPLYPPPLKSGKLP